MKLYQIELVYDYKQGYSLKTSEVEIKRQTEKMIYLEGYDIFSRQEVNKSELDGLICAYRSDAYLTLNKEKIKEYEMCLISNEEEFLKRKIDKYIQKYNLLLKLKEETK